jgi:hypothetical protein
LVGGGTVWYKVELAPFSGWKFWNPLVPLIGPLINPWPGFTDPVSLSFAAYKERPSGHKMLFK